MYMYIHIHIYIYIYIRGNVHIYTYMKNIIRAAPHCTPLPPNHMADILKIQIAAQFAIQNAQGADF